MILLFADALLFVWAGRIARCWTGSRFWRCGFRTNVRHDRHASHSGERGHSFLLPQAQAGGVRMDGWSGGGRKGLETENMGLRELKRGRVSGVKGGQRMVVHGGQREGKRVV